MNEQVEVSRKYHEDLLNRINTSNLSKEDIEVILKLIFNSMPSNLIQRYVYTGINTPNKFIVEVL